MHSRLVGFITFSQRLLWNQRYDDERRARGDTAPLGNVSITDEQAEDVTRPLLQERHLRGRVDSDE